MCVCLCVRVCVCVYVCVCCSSLLFTKVKLEEALFGPSVALQTCEDMLQLWQRRYDGNRVRCVCL